ncbi:MAG: hypothetical protein L6R39_006830 [Caloplaca ligustica]|nr:MAG: hypothetical protein L6R39_006830 [Caloplaca ligustica]
MDPEDSSSDILSCPALKASRYQYLKNRECEDILPRSLGSVLQTISFLGPENCALSIVEGRSSDGTYEVFLSLRKALEEAGITYFLTTSDINPEVGHRIVGLAALRNLALQPVFDNAATLSKFDPTIIFINDISLCMEDILELIHQRQ